MRQRLAAIAGAVSIFAAAAAAVRASVYPDATGEQAGTNNPDADIASVEVTNDATNLSFKITLTGDISQAGVTDWGNYHIGLDTVAGGKTDVGVAWGNPFGMSSGMDFWIGSWVNFAGGAELHSWDGAAWSATIPGSTVTLAQFSTTITLPLANLGLSTGNTFNFDVWSTYGTPGGQSAYDASSNPALTVADPWNGTPYDAALNVSTYTVSVPVAASTWNVDADGNWSQAANWLNGVPNAVGAAANFGTIITSARTVTVDAPQTVGTITFDNANSYTVTGSSTLTLDASSGGAALNVANGSHAIAAPLVLNDALTATVGPAASTLTVSNLQPASSTITKAGAGNLAVNSVRASALSVNAGTVSVLSNGGASGASRVGTLALAGGLTPTASLDLSDNDLLVTNGSVATVAAQVAAARNGGGWDAPGLTSSAARTHAQQATTLGVISGADYISVNGTSFNGFPVAATDVVVKYTWYGDADLNGEVNFDDYVFVDGGFNNGLSGWFNGDFDFSGAVDFDDYVFIDLGFNAQSGTLRRAQAFLDGTDRSSNGMSEPSLRLIVEHFDRFGTNYAHGFLSAVPEPGSTLFGCVVASATMLLRRRPQ